MIDTIREQIKEAMKARDAARLAALKMLSSELHNAQIEKPDFTDDDAMVVVKKEVKKRRDSIDAYNKAGRQELAEAEKQELDVLMEFLPEQMTDDQIGMMVDEAIAEIHPESMKDMGRVIGWVVSKAEGAADSAIVAQIAKDKLQNLS